MTASSAGDRVPEPDRVIAVEEHFASREFMSAAANLAVWPSDARELEIMRGPFSSESVIDRLSNLETRIADMDMSGTDTAVLSLNFPGAHPYEPGAAASALAATANDDLARVVKANPSRFAGLGCVAPQHPEHAADEVVRVMTALRLSGVMIYSHAHGVYLDDPSAEPILAAAEACRAPIYLHPRMPAGAMVGPFRDYGLIGAVWGHSADASTHALRLILSGVLDRHPKLAIVLGRLGEGLPWWMKRIDDRHAFAFAAAGEMLGMTRLELTPSEYMLRNFMLTTAGMPDHDALEFCLNRFGEDRIMFAIDYPYESSIVATEFLRSADLTVSQRAKISHQNAERVFNIPSFASPR